MNPRASIEFRMRRRKERAGLGLIHDIHAVDVALAIIGKLVFQQ